MTRGPAVFLLHHEELEYFGWEVYAIFAIGCVAVCLLLNLLARHDLKKILGRKRTRRTSGSSHF